MAKGLLFLVALSLPFATAHAQAPKRHMITYDELLASSVAAADRIVAYGSDPLQFGELRLPAGNAKAPLIVLIHGGCWLSAYNLDHTRGFAAALVKEGYAVWSPEYRRLGDAGGGWPGTFDDIALATDYVPTLAAANARIDLSRVITMGHSAGGQLAVWAASRTDAKALKVKGAVSLAGILDMATYGEETGSCNASVHRLLGGSASEQPDRYKAVDPMRRVPIAAPVRIVHGANDPTVRVAQSQTFVEKNRAAGGSVELEVVPASAHFDVVAPNSDAFPAVLRAIHALVP
jgi:acetyl esterase/lipase